MKAHLLFKDADFGLDPWLSPHAEELVRDLQLTVLFETMAAEDDFTLEVSRKVLLAGLRDVEAIRYRQDVLRDCLQHPSVLREMYDLVVVAIEKGRKHYFGSYLRAQSILYTALDLLEILVEALKKLRTIAEEHSAEFTSGGFQTFFSMVKGDLDDIFFGRAEQHMSALRLRNGILLQAGLGTGGKGAGHILLEADTAKIGFFERLFGPQLPQYSFEIMEGDQAGALALTELRERGINRVASALAQSTEHIRSFLTALRTELAFFIACVNLHDRLVALDEPTCFPVPSPAWERQLSATGLYDACLALHRARNVVGNDLEADGKELLFITGANEGGKSTFLRSMGVAQLMMQAGMFVPAQSLRASISSGVFSHFRRPEDRGMKSGKLEEELARMSLLVDRLAPHSIVLLNESFSSTNEREGSEIARQIVSAFVDRQIRVLFVTHLYELSKSFHDRRLPNVLFLHAERREDGTRTFRIVEREPRETSFGEDLYRLVFDSTRGR
jgi:hypothetical protein